MHPTPLNRRNFLKLALCAAAFALAACQAKPPATLAPLPSLAVTLGPDPGPKGDPDGSGSALITLDAGKQEICFELRVADIDLPALAAHIHKGRAGENGPIVVALAAPDASGSAQGCRQVEGSVFSPILSTPSNYYVWVHTEDSGILQAALRGQLP